MENEGLRDGRRSRLPSRAPRRCTQGPLSRRQVCGCEALLRPTPTTARGLTEHLPSPTVSYLELLLLHLAGLVMVS